jgi:subtilisin family serine protease
VAAQGPPERELSVIVVLEPGADPEAVARGAGVNPRRVYRNVFRGFAGRVPEQALRGLRNNPRVRLVSEDRPVTIAQQAIPAGVIRVDADQYPGFGDGNATDADVAIIDSGIDRDHPDLNVAGGVDCTGTGSYDDNNGHGTHVAGTIGAIDNGTGVIGVAPGARLWGVKVLGATGGGTWSSVICGIDWVFSQGAAIDVANMSLGGFGSDNACGDDALHLAICRLVGGGTPVAAAAGNDNMNAAGFVPATYDEVIAVSAFADYDGQPGGQSASACGAPEPDDSFAVFSNYGADVDIAAPGRCIRSTYPGGTYQSLSGTSMAAPHVAGAVALYKADNPTAGPSQVRQWLLSSASEPRNSTVGFRGDTDGIPERVLNLDLATTAALDPALAEPNSPAPVAARVGPIAKNDAFRAQEDKALRRAAPGVLANDADPDGPRPRVKRIVKKPAHGTLRLQANGAIVYKPKRNYNGLDSFIYEVVDRQGLTDTAKVTIRVRARPN